MEEEKTDSQEKDDAQFEVIESKEEMRAFLETVREQLREELVAPVYALSALNYALNQPNVYDYFDEGIKEIARDIWYHIRKSGVQHEEPPMLAVAEKGN